MLSEVLSVRSAHLPQEWVLLIREWRFVWQWDLASEGGIAKDTCTENASCQVQVDVLEYYEHQIRSAYDIHFIPAVLRVSSPRPLQLWMTQGDESKFLQFGSL